MKLNKKGFVVSSLLYALLIVFLLTMLLTLSSFSDVTSLISASNEDIIENDVIYMKNIGTFNDWNEAKNNSNKNKLVKIVSKYGTKYWPKDFNLGTGISNDSSIMLEYRKKDSDETFGADFINKVTDPLLKDYYYIKAISSDNKASGVVWIQFYDEQQEQSEESLPGDSD